MLFIGQRRWYSRIGAIVYAWTVGLVVGLVFLALGLLYAATGSVLKLTGVGNVKDIPLWGSVRTVFEWWFSIHDHAISGTGTWSLAPPMLR